jgi:hypothetical protein
VQAQATAGGDDHVARHDIFAVRTIDHLASHCDESASLNGVNGTLAVAEPRMTGIG